MKRLLLRFVITVCDVVAFPFVLIAAALLWVVRRVGLQRLPVSRLALQTIGLLPIRNHYYEPYMPAKVSRSLAGVVRDLPGIDWNVAGQLSLLESMTYADELPDLHAPRTSEFDFRLGNGAFESGDAEYLYQLIRLKKPRRVIEVGSGNSTLIAQRALRRNAAEPNGHASEHICIEPYEMPWLERSGVTVLRRRVEEVDLEMFRELGRDDLLFIDSSHIIRPGGDVLKEFLEILPQLAPGVIVHVHDICSPRHYLQEWLVERVSLWNEQYLLEAFLTQNRDWTILGALNMLLHEHFDALRRCCPYITPDREPVSFYIQRVG